MIDPRKRAGKCVHCAKKSNRLRRNLCVGCYSNLEVRRRYGRYGRGVPGDFFGPSQQPASGHGLFPFQSDGQRNENLLQVMAARALRGEAMHSPHDATAKVDLN